MKKSINMILAALILIVTLYGAAMAQMNDVKGSQDPALFTRMPNFKIYEYRDLQFDAYKFRVTRDGKQVVENPEGHLIYWKYMYDKSTGATPPSKLQILRNYQAAAANLGGEVIFENPNVTTIKIAKDEKIIWVEVASVATGTEYALRILEQQAMKQDVVTNAEALKAGLAAIGHVELKGVFFDTGKADIKPESEVALKEAVKLLKQSPELKVWVVGHTDYMGTAHSNLELSSARAASVVKYLTQTLGIDEKRLGSFGAGPYTPVATNSTEEGRTKNRRVELVVQP